MDKKGGVDHTYQNECSVHKIAVRKEFLEECFGLESCNFHAMGLVVRVVCSILAQRSHGNKIGRQTEVKVHENPLG
jgi:hypothetical protein